jgi:hypothetical protein
MEKEILSKNLKENNITSKLKQYLQKKTREDKLHKSITNRKIDKIIE